MRLSDNLRGAFYMTLAMAIFALEDGQIKLIAGALPIGQIMLLIGLLGLIFFAIMARREGQSLMPAAFLAKPMLLRSGFEIAGRAFYGLALAFAPLSTSSAILQAAPLVVIAGAALVFGEKVSLGRWLAVFVGFFGVMIILQPGSDSFSPLSIFAVLGMIGFACRDLATRAAPKTLSNWQLGILGFTMLSIAGAIVLGFTRDAIWPDAWQGLILFGATFAATAGYYWLTIAMRTGEISAIAPFRYMRLPFAILLAVFTFGETLTQSMIIGSLMVVLSGIYGLSRR